MITRNAFLGESLDQESIERISNAIGDRWELEKGAGWTDEYFIHICTFDVDNIEMDCYTETHADVFEDDLRKILDELDVSYTINQY